MGQETLLSQQLHPEYGLPVRLSWPFPSLPVSIFYSGRFLTLCSKYFYLFALIADHISLVDCCYEMLSNILGHG